MVFKIKVYQKPVKKTSVDKINKIQYEKFN